MTQPTSDLNWKRSSRCDTGACVEVAHGPYMGEVLIRTTNRPGRAIVLTPDEWDVFKAGIRDGDFDK